MVSSFSSSINFPAATFSAALLLLLRLTDGLRV
jgi:hypothetical protein